MMHLSPKAKRIVKLLNDAGVFDFSNGSVTLHYDNNGQLRKIEKRMITLTPREDR